jgi:hypothetical protein
MASEADRDRKRAEWTAGARARGQARLAAMPVPKPVSKPEWVDVPAGPDVDQPAATSWRPSDREAAERARWLVLDPRHRADQRELQLVTQLRSAGFSWERIAGVFGRSRQAHRVQLERLCRERKMSMRDLDGRGA